MWLNDSARDASSAAPSAGTGPGASPAASLCVASATRRRGRAMRRASNSETTPAMREIAAESRTTNAIAASSCVRRLRARTLCAGELVADAADRLHELGPSELAAKRSDVHVDGARSAGEREAPDAVEQQLARQH